MASTYSARLNGTEFSEIQDLVRVATDAHVNPEGSTASYLRAKWIDLAIPRRCQALL